MRSPVPRTRTAMAMLIALLAGLLVMPAASLAQAASRIDLPDGWQPEGITTDGTYLYAGSLADGAIFRADPATGEGEVFIAGQEGEVAVGMDVGPGGDRLWVAGGDTGEVRVYDLATGSLIQGFDFEAGFLNDLVATDEAVYVTDSFMPQLIVIPTGEALAAPDDASTLPLTGELEYQEGFNLNGIASTDGSLVSVHSPTGTLYRIDPDTAETTRIMTDADLTAGDGLELVDSRLHVVRNQVGRIAVLELAPDLSSADLVTELTPEDVDVPTTGAYLDGALWVVNARFGTDPTPDTEYWMTRIETTGEGEGAAATQPAAAAPSPAATAMAEDEASAAAPGMQSPPAEPMTTDGPAAGAADPPTGAVLGLFDALAAGEYGSLEGFFCQEFASQAAQLDFSGMAAGLPPGVDADTLTRAIRIIPEVQAIETVERSDEQASVRVAGSLSLEVDVEALEPLITALLEATGQEVTQDMVDLAGNALASQFAAQSFDIDEEVTVVEEDGRWVVCDVFGGAGMVEASPAPATLEPAG